LIRVRPKGFTPSTLKGALGPISGERLEKRGEREKTQIVRKGTTCGRKNTKKRLNSKDVAVFQD